MQPTATRTETVDTEAPIPQLQPQEASILSKLSFEQLQQLIVLAVEQGKKPDAKTAAREADEQARKEKQKADMLEAVRIEEDGKKRMQDACPHQKENGRSAIHGQVHSDGLIHPLCVHCFKEFDAYAPGQEMVARGLA